MLPKLAVGILLLCLIGCENDNADDKTSKEVCAVVQSWATTKADSVLIRAFAPPGHSDNKCGMYLDRTK